MSYGYVCWQLASMIRTFRPYPPRELSEPCCPNIIINIIKFCLTDTLLYIYIYVKHFGMANIKSRYKLNIEALSWNHCCCRDTVSITYSECVFVAFVIWHAMRMPDIVICGLSGCTVFSTVSHILHNFRSSLLNIKCVLWLFPQLHLKNFSL